MQWATLRKKPEPLSFRQIVALSGLSDQALMAPHEDDPYSAPMWEKFVAMGREMLTNAEPRRRARPAHHPGIDI